LIFCDVPYPVDTKNQRDEHETEQRREETRHEIGRSEKAENTGSSEIKEGPMVTGVVLPNSLGQELVGEPGMDCFVVV